MREQPPTFTRIRLILALAEGHISADGECTCIERTSLAIGIRAGVHANVAESLIEQRFEVRPDVRR